MGVCLELLGIGGPLVGLGVALLRSSPGSNGSISNKTVRSQKVVSSRLRQKAEERVKISSFKFKSYNLQQQTRRKVIDRVDITLAAQSLCTLYMKLKFEQIACTFCSKLTPPGSQQKQTSRFRSTEYEIQT